MKDAAKAAEFFRQSRLLDLEYCNYGEKDVERYAFSIMRDAWQAS